MTLISFLIPQNEDSGFNIRCPGVSGVLLSSCPSIPGAMNPASISNQQGREADCPLGYAVVVYHCVSCIYVKHLM